jgi:hypothetical protein
LTRRRRRRRRRRSSSRRRRRMKTLLVRKEMSRRWRLKQKSNVIKTLTTY